MNRSSGQPASDPGGMRYSSLADIHRTNVARLQLAWTWTNDEPRGTGPDATLLPLGKFETTPLMAGDTLFLTTPNHRVVALDAESGAQFWSFDPRARESGPPRRGHRYVHRGLAQYPADSVTGRRIFHATAAGYSPWTPRLERWTPLAACCTCRSPLRATTTTAAGAPAQVPSPNRSSAWTPSPAGGSGTSRRSTTGSGTSIFPARRCSPRCAEGAARGRRRDRQQNRIPLRLRSCDRYPGLAHRGTTGSRQRRSRRKHLPTQPFPTRRLRLRARDSPKAT